MHRRIHLQHARHAGAGAWTRVASRSPHRNQPQQGWAGSKHAPRCLPPPAAAAPQPQRHSTPHAPRMVTGGCQRRPRCLQRPARRARLGPAQQRRGGRTPASGPCTCPANACTARQVRHTHHSTAWYIMAQHDTARLSRAGCPRLGSAGASKAPAAHLERLPVDQPRRQLHLSHLSAVPDIHHVKQLLHLPLHQGTAGKMGLPRPARCAAGCASHENLQPAAYATATLPAAGGTQSAPVPAAAGDGRSSALQAGEQADEWRSRSGKHIIKVCSSLQREADVWHVVWTGLPAPHLGRASHAVPRSTPPLHTTHTPPPLTTTATPTQSQRRAGCLWPHTPGRRCSWSKSCARRWE